MSVSCHLINLQCHQQELTSLIDRPFYVIVYWERCSMLHKLLRFSQRRLGSRCCFSFWQSTKFCCRHQQSKTMLAISFVSAFSPCCLRSGFWHASNVFLHPRFGKLFKNLAQVGVTGWLSLNNGTVWILRWLHDFWTLLTVHRFLSWRFVSLFIDS